MKNNSSMKAHAIFLLVINMLSFSFFVDGAEFVKGTHYNELSQPINDNKEVREFFSFYCPACYRHEPIINELEAKLPADLNLVKNHISGMPGRDVVVEEGLSKALLTAQRLNIEDEIAASIFKRIHVDKTVFSHDKDIRELFLLHDIAPSRADNIFDSFSVNMNIKRMKKLTEILQNQGVTRVPTIIVNGKYQVETGAIKSKEEYIELVLYLTGK
jgi:thiol:disulfide interchange protein DsbA